MSVNGSRSTEDVLEDHLERRCRGEFEAELQRNHAPDVVMLVAGQSRPRRTAVGRVLGVLRHVAA